MSCLSEFKIHISPIRTCIIVGDYSGLTKFRFRLPDFLFNSPNFEVHTFFFWGGDVPGGDSRLKNCKQKITLNEFLLSLFLCPYLQLNEVCLVAFQLKHLATVLMTSFKFNFKVVYFARRQNTVETLHFGMV